MSKAKETKESAQQTKPASEIHFFRNREQLRAFLDSLPTVIGKTGFLTQFDDWGVVQIATIRPLFVAEKVGNNYELYRCLEVGLAGSYHLLKEHMRTLVP